MTTYYEAATLRAHCATVNAMGQQNRQKSQFLLLLNHLEYNTHFQQI